MGPYSNLDSVISTSWQSWDILLSHLRNSLSSKVTVGGSRDAVSQSGSYTKHELYYVLHNPQHAIMAYIRLQDNLNGSILQNHILPPLDCLENQIEALASLLVQRFGERGLWYILVGP